MFAVRIKRSGSWLDPESSGLLGWILGKKLWARVAGQPAVFITLTYRREEYGSSQELYWRQAERQDVPLFMRRLSRRLNVSLKGKWICKMEFQRGGWVHWHLIVVGVGRVDHSVLADAWGYGFTWIRKVTKRRVLYTCKYVAKGGNDKVPAWLYGERPRSVKIVRTSKGFWGKGGGKSRYCGVYERYGPVKSPGVVAYVPIGERIEEKGVEVKVCGKRFSKRCNPGLLFWQLRWQHTGCRNGWQLYFGKASTVDGLPAAGGLASSAAAPSAAAEPGHLPRSGIHLRETRIPDVGRLPWWVQMQFEQEGMEAFELCESR